MLWRGIGALSCKFGPERWSGRGGGMGAVALREELRESNARPGPRRRLRKRDARALAMSCAAQGDSPSLEAVLGKDHLLLPIAVSQRAEEVAEKLRTLSYTWSGGATALGNKL